VPAVTAARVAGDSLVTWLIELFVNTGGEGRDPSLRSG
jgi:hypothetical protein